MKKIMEVMCFNYNWKVIKFVCMLFLIYLIFFFCWILYVLIIVVDRNDMFFYELYLIFIVFGYFYFFINWFIYYFINIKFCKVFDELVKLNKFFDLCKVKKKVEVMEMIKIIINFNDLLVMKI